LKVFLKVGGVGNYEHAAHRTEHLELGLLNLLHNNLGLVLLILAKLLLAHTCVQLLKSSG
jgi:hypothetical protein